MDDGVRSELIRRRELHGLIALNIHKSEQHTGETLTKLVFKCSGAKLKNYRIKERNIRAESLYDMRLNGSHELATPKWFEYPVLLVETDTLYIMDGQNRINYWHKHGMNPLVRCLVVVVE